MTKTSRNAPCPCGSGKKYKKCCEGKYPRDRCVYIGYREPFQGVTFENGQVLVHLPSGEKKKADAVFSQTQYSRRSGKDKVVSRVGDKVTLDVATFLASDFDVIFAIDTNTKQIGDDLISVSCVLECVAEKVERAQEVSIRCRQCGIITFKNCIENEAEKFAWAKLVSIATSGARYSNKLRVCLITDHDLGMHGKYNSRELPIYKDVFLPANFTLVYAAGDAGKENVLNMLIVECDKQAGSILAQLEKNGCASSGNSVVTIEKIPDLKFQ